MKLWLTVAVVTALAATNAAHESRIAIPGGAHLLAREIGRGDPILVLHGGPDFDHTYLLPDLDRLADGYRLIYYDQRGRGRSADGVRAEDVTLASDIADVERVRKHFHVGSATVLGHSWGTVLALEYALRHPQVVSRLILMNPAPASAADVTRFREAYREKQGASALDRMRAVAATDAYKQGRADGVETYYRIHFAPALQRPEDLDRLLTIMRPSFETTDVLKARAVEQRLYQDTWEVKGYDLMPKLAALKMPALVIWGDHDFIPREVSEHIAGALPNGRLVTLDGCGHFPYLECPEATRQPIDAFMRAR